MTQLRFRMAQPRLIFIHWLYLAKLNPVLCIGDKAQFVEYWTDDFEIASSNPLNPLLFFQQCSFLYMWRPTIRMTEA